jgi:hypothetical protein
LQAKRLLATVQPRSLVGKTMRRMAAEEISDLVAVDAKLKAITTEPPELTDGFRASMCRLLSPVLPLGSGACARDLHRRLRSIGVIAYRPPSAGIVGPCQTIDGFVPTATTDGLSARSRA